MSLIERTIELGALSVKVVGAPGTGGGRVIAQSKNPDVSYPEAVAIDVLESVILALHARGALTADVEAALKDSYDAIGNNIHALGDRAKTDGESSPYALFAQEALHTDDQEFDDRVIVSMGDDRGAFVNGWTWVPETFVESFIRRKLEAEHGTLDVLQGVGIDSLEDAIEDEGVVAVFEKIKHLLPGRESVQSRQREPE